MPKGANHIFWQTVHAGAIKAAEEYGLDIEWNAPTLEIDASRQIDIVESMMTRHLAGVAVAPVDRTALVGVVERARTADDPGGDVRFGRRYEPSAYLCGDGQPGSRPSGSALSRRPLVRRGRGGIIGFVPGSASTMEREQGFAAEMKKSYPGIRIVQTVYGMADRAKARRDGEHPRRASRSPRSFRRQRIELRGSGDGTEGAEHDAVRAVAFDANEQLIADVQDRRIDALVMQNPFRMGYESVKAIGMRLRDDDAAASDSGVQLVTRVDMERPDIVELLHPDLQRWLRGRRRQEPA